MARDGRNTENGSHWARRCCAHMPNDRNLFRGNGHSSQPWTRLLAPTFSTPTPREKQIDVSSRPPTDSPEPSLPNVEKVNSPVTQPSRHVRCRGAPEISAAATTGFVTAACQLPPRSGGITGPRLFHGPMSHNF